MRGSNSNGKYPSRGGSSFRGSSMSGPYGYYHDPYYSSSPSRGGRGSSRGRGGSSSYGYYGSSAGYGGRKDVGDPQGHSHGSYQYAHSGSGLTPTSSASGQASEQGSSAGSATYERSGDSAGDSGYGGPAVPSSSGGSNEMSGDDYESTRWDHYGGEYSRGKSDGSPRFRGRGRGRGSGGRGAWRGSSSRGGSGSGAGPYYGGRGRAGYDYDAYNAVQGSGQYYYGREFSGDAVNAGSGEGYKYHGHEEDGYAKTHAAAKEDSAPLSAVPVAPSAAVAATATKTSATTTTTTAAAAAAAKLESEKLTAEEARLKREHDHRKNLEFREKHWIGRIEATGETRRTLSRCFNELDAVNTKLLDLGTRRAELEIEVNRYNRVLRAEEDRVRLAEEKLEAMNLSF